MATAYICGRECSVKFGSDVTSGYKYEIKLDGKEEDVTHFGSTEYGDYQVCMINGTFTVDSYEAVTGDVSDVVSLSSTIGETTVTYAGVILSKATSVDAKGIVSYTTSARITGTSS